MSANQAADVASNLRLIEDMALRLEARAIDRAGDKSLPGGEALVNLASVGSMRDWTRRYEIGEESGNYDTSSEDPDELWPAVQVLWYWSETYRQDLNHDYDDPRWRPTLLSEARFLRNADVATWIWDNEVHYGDYAKDVARAKSKLENILHEGDRSERTAVVCDRCDAGRQLIRVYAPAEHVADECPDCHATYQPLEVDDCRHCGIVLQPVHKSNPADDRWKCPGAGCKHLFDSAELDDLRAAQMRRSEPREWIPRTHAIALLRSLGHQERVAARLVDAEDVGSRCDSTSRLRWVVWPEVWRNHLVMMQDKKIKAARRSA